MIHRTWIAFGFSLALAAICGTNVSAGSGGSQGAADDAGASEPRPEASGPKYLLRYKFKPGETIRWKVEHRAEVRTTINGTTQTAETVSNSVKVWRVSTVDAAKQQARFVHSVDSIDMRQVMSGRQELRYNSETDATAPPGFEQVAKDVGVPLSEFTIDLRGYVLLRDELRKGSRPSDAEITIPLADKPVAIGEVWSQPNLVTVKYKDGSPKQVKTRQDYKLASVEKGIATIALDTTIVTPINDAGMEAQLIQQVVDGTIRFDVDAGRVISQQTDIDKHVIGFQGETSSLHYVTRFKEQLESAESSAKVKAPTGPPLPGTLPPKTAQAPSKAPAAKSSDTGKPTSKESGTKPPAAKAPVAKSPAVVQPGTKSPAAAKGPAAQTARGPAAKTPPTAPGKKPATAAKPSTPGKSTAPEKTARRDPPASTSPAAKPATTPAPPKPSPPQRPTPPATEAPAARTDPDA